MMPSKGALDERTQNDGYCFRIVAGGNGGIGGGSSSASASDIFSNDDFNDVSWNMVDYLLEDILNDCMGEALFNGIKEKLNGDKIKIRFSF